MTFSSDFNFHPPDRLEERTEVRINAAASSLDPPFWSVAAVILNRSERGLLLGMARQPSDIKLGGRLKVRFGTTVVTGSIRHLSLSEEGVRAGILLEGIPQRPGPSES